MNRILLWIAFAFISLSAFAQQNPQNSCGEKGVMEKLFRQFPAIKIRQDSIEKQWSIYVKQGQSRAARPVGATYTLPVVVHIIHNNGPENISDAQVMAAIQHLNDAYANIGYYDPSDGVDTKIQFCMAERDPNGNATNGITRDVSPYTVMSGGADGTDYSYDDQNVKNINRWNPGCYINIWLVSSIPTAVVGYAYLPGAAGTYLDGIIIEAAYFGSSYSNDVVAIHEMGHYLGMYHTFEGGCTNNDCTTDGDLICDTPPDNSTAWISCGSTQNSCTTDVNSGFATDQNDLLSDYMDYGNWDCMKVFTQGQSDKMNWTVANIRSSLLKCKSCLSPCPLPVKAVFSSPGSTVDAGSSFTFINTSTNATGYAWYVNGVLQSNAANYTFTFNNIATYKIELYAKSGNSSLCSDDSTTITVQAVCPVKASFTKSAVTVAAGTTINFTNTSTGADSYEWYLNNVLQSTTANYNYVSTVAGQYAIKLIAKNSVANCTGQYIDTITFTCPVNAAFTPLSANITLNNTVNFINASSGATSYKWLVNGSLSGSGNNFSPLFSLAGNYVVQLLATNGVCSSTKSAFVVVTDTCLRYTFQKTYSAGGNDVSNGICKTTDGGFIICGQTNSFGVGGDYNAYLMKIDYQGNIVWNKSYGGSGNDNLNFVQPTPDGGYIAIGQSTSFIAAGDIAATDWIIKVDGLGNLQWSKQYGSGGQNEVVLGLTITSDGGSIFLGDHYNTPGSADAMVIKLDANGNLLWGKGFDTGGQDEAAGVYEETDGYVITGQYASSTYLDGFIMKLNKLTGAVQWIKGADFGGRTNRLGAIFKQGDNYIIGGTDGDGPAQTNAVETVVISDLNGNITQATETHTTPQTVNGPFDATGDGGYIHTTGIDIANAAEDVSFIKHATDGSIEWAKTYTQAGVQYSNAVLQNDDNTFISAGSTSSGSVNSIAIMKVDILGGIAGCAPPSDLPATTLNVAVTPQNVNWQSIYDLSYYKPAAVQPSVRDIQFTVTGNCGGSTCVPLVTDSCSTDNFQITYGGSGDDYAADINQTSDGNFIIAGQTNSYGAGGVDGLLFKLDKTGKILWSKTYGGSADDIFSGVKETTDRGFITVGTTKSYNPVPAAWAVKTDANGTVQWSKQYSANTPNGEAATQIIQTADGGYVLVGAENLAPGVANIMIIKLDVNGNVQWNKIFDEGSSDEANDVIEDNGAIVVTGFVRSQVFTDYYDVFLVKLNETDGTVLWSHAYDLNHKNNSPFKINKIPDGYGVDIYSSNYFDSTGESAMYMTTDELGNVTSAKQLNPGAHLEGGFFNTGSTTVVAFADDVSTDINIYEYDPNGKTIWAKRYIQPGTQRLGLGVFRTLSNDGVIIAGQTTQNAANADDIIIIKTNGQDKNSKCPTVNETDSIVDVAYSSPQYSWENVSSLSSISAPAVTVQGIDQSIVDSQLCASSSLCNLLQLQAPDSVCNFSDTIVCFAKRNAQCSSPVQWSTDTSIVNVTGSTDSTLRILFKKSGVVKITGTINTGCKILSDSLTITGFRSPNKIDLGPDINLCTSSVVTLHAGAGFRLYLWQNNTTDSNLTAYLPGTYSVTATDYCGNVYSDTIVISQAPNVPFNLGNDTSLCVGDSILLTAPAGFTNYLWSPAYKINPTAGQSVTVFTDVDTMYVVTAQKQFGCTVVDSIKIRIKKDIPIHLGNDTSFCAGNPFVLDAGAGYSNYNWSTGDIAQIISITSKGTYTVSATDKNGCIDKDTIIVKNIYAAPAINLGNDTSICGNANFVLNAGAGYKTYTWQDGSTGQTYTANKAGTYYVQVSDINNCIGNDTIKVIAVNKIAALNLGDDTTVCSSGNLILDAGSGFASYTWQDGSGLQTYSVTATGKYSVQVTDNNFCKGSDTINITVTDIPTINLGNDTTICMGTTLLLNPGAHATYLWQDGSSGKTFSANTVGDYSVQVTDLNNPCIGKASVSIIAIADSAKGFLDPSLQICAGANTVITATGMYDKYFWSTGSRTNSIVVTDTGTYILTVTNSNQCKSTERIIVTNDPDCRSIYFPNAFTPNKDNLNDYFMPKVYGLLSQFKLTIFNRWGVKVFETTDYKNGWDGTYNNQPQNTGAYVWIAEYQFDNVPAKTEKGTLLLIR